MTDAMDPTGPTDPTDPDAEGDDATPSRTPWLVGGGIVAVVAVIVALLLFTSDDDGDDDVVTGASSTTVVEATTTTVGETTTTEAPTTTEAATTTTTGAGAPTIDPADVPFVLWPDPGGDARYDDPVAAASSFATEIVGFSDPLVGEFMQGDSRSGEVEVQPREDGAVTTVMVRQYGSDDSWWVIGAATDDITISDPRPQDTVGNPMHLEGTALAFEGTVLVSVFADGSADPFATGFVTGSGSPPAAPFSDDILLGDDVPTGYGTLLLYTDSAEDGSVVSATAIRIALPG